MIELPKGRWAMGTAVAVREVTASWCLSTRRPSIEEEQGFLRSARRAVRDWSAYLGAAPTDVDDAVLAANELVTNAIQYGHAPYELHMREVVDGLRWSVIDSGAGQPAIRSALARARSADALLAETGRGLALVTRLYPGACELRVTTNVRGEPATEVAFTMPRPVHVPAV